MSKVTVRIPTPLRSFVGESGEVAVDPFRKLSPGSKDPKRLAGLDMAPSDCDMLSIVPVEAGG
jgi:molybdopterin converting factor small subunit